MGIEAISNVENRTIGRAIKLLEAVANADRPLISAEIARLTGLHRATCHRLLTVLCQMGYLQRDEKSRTYMTGFYLHTFGRPENLIRIVVSRSHDLLSDCAANLDAPVMLGYLQGVQIVVCDEIRIGQLDTRSLVPSNRYGSHCTAIGKALLALKTPEEVRHIFTNYPLFSRTPKTRTSIESLLSDLRRSERLGYATSDEEDETGVFEGAVPVLNPERRATFAIGFRARKHECTDAILSQKFAILKDFSKRITKDLTGLEVGSN